MRQIALQEFEILHAISHPNIVKMHQSFVSNSQIHLVMDFVAGRALSSIVKDTKLTEA